MEIFSENLQNYNYFLIVGSIEIGFLSFCEYFTKEDIEKITNTVNYEICLDELLIDEKKNGNNNLNTSEFIYKKSDIEYKLANKHDFLNPEDPLNIFKSLYMKHRDSPQWFFICIGTNEINKENLNSIRDVLFFRKHSGVFQFIGNEDFQYYLDFIKTKFKEYDLDYNIVKIEFNE